METDILSSESITKDLNSRFIGQKVIYYTSISSTNYAARQEAISGAPAGTVVAADIQTSGRGRLNRNWVSPKGSVSLSVILRPNISYLPRLIMLSSVAVVQTVEKLTLLNAEIKWPNDVLIAGKKVCGILIENEIRKNKLVFTVIGIGVNVNVRLADYPDLEPFATSLSDELHREVSRVEFMRQLLIELDDLYQKLPSENVVFELWRRKLVVLGKKVHVAIGDEVIDGIAESVSPDGNLFVRRQDGTLAKVIVGDASLRI